MTEPAQKYNGMQKVKRRFFAMRNGVIADVLRRGGSPFRIIFGLNLPQLVEIASESGPDPELGAQLWANTTTRESMLLAPMLMAPDSFPYEQAMRWAAEVPTPEIADNLCHKLLRKTPYARDLASALAESESAMDRYVAVRLMFNLVDTCPEQAHQIAAIVAAVPDRLTDTVAQSLLDEASYLMNPD